MARKLKDDVAAASQSIGAQHGNVAANSDANGPAVAPESIPSAPSQQLENNMVQQILERQAVFGF